MITITVSGPTGPRSQIAAGLTRDFERNRHVVLRRIGTAHDVPAGVDIVIVEVPS